MPDDVGIDVHLSRLAVVQAALELRQLLTEVEPEMLSGAECLEVAEMLARTERACAAARLAARPE